MKTLTKMKKGLTLDFLAALLVIFLGNLFWFVLFKSFNKISLDSNFTLGLIVSLSFSIILFSMYISSYAVFYSRVKNRIIWLIVVLFSTGDYSLILGLNLSNIIGQFVIAAVFFIFLLNLQRYQVLVNGVPSIGRRVNLAFLSVSFLISITLGFNFYKIYSNSVSSNNIVISNRIFTSILSPIGVLYNYDLKVIDPNEKFSDYLQRIYKSTHVSPAETKFYTLQKLNLSSADDSTSMKDLISQSLNLYALRITKQYNSTFSLLVSLGFAVSLQTLTSIASIFSMYLIMAISIFFKKINLQ